jgi:hypothetical protein
MSKIDELVAGRELDARVAEKVMGWEPRGPHPIHGTPVFATGRNDTFAPHFSTDIAAAWQAAEKLKAASWRFRVWQDYKDALMVDAETAPLAICRAALKALEVQP